MELSILNEGVGTVFLLDVTVPTDTKMTKFEIIGVNLTDEEKFNESLAEFRLKCRTLRIALTVSVHDSRILTFSQRQQVLKLCEQIEFLENAMLNWKFHGKKDQMEFDFS